MASQVGSAVLSLQVDAQQRASVVARFILTGAEKDGEAQREAEKFGDILFTDDRLSGYRSIVHKTYFVLEYVVRAARPTELGLMSCLLLPVYLAYGARTSIVINGDLAPRALPLTQSCLTH